MPRHDIVNPGGDSQYTPPWIFEALNIEFDLDVCAPPGGIPWIPAKNHYSEKDDGLTSEWYGRVWMNPPYSGIKPWINKFTKHGNGIALVLIAKSKWLENVWDTAPALLVPDVQIKFINENGVDKSIYMPVVLLAYGEESIQALKDSNIGRVR